MIHLEGVRARAGGFALGPVDLHVEAREYLVVLGPSGAGKTLLLDVIAGFQPLVAGAVKLRGAGVAGVAPRARKIGWLAGGQSVFPHLSVRANLAYGLAHLDAATRAERVRRYADELDLTPLLDRRPPTLSQGERQRVAIARALAPEPDILLCDEPFTFLDRGRSRRFWEMMRRLHQQHGLTVAHVTHDLDEARALATRVVVFIGGAIAQAGSADDVMTRPASEAVASALGL